MSHNRYPNLDLVRYILVFKPFPQAEKKVAELMTLDDVDRLDNGDETLKESVRATPKPASSMAHSTVTRALALWAHT